MAFQTITPVKIGQAAITIAAATLYTVPAATRTFVKDMDICNTTNTAIAVSVFLVPSAGAASASNALFYNTSVPANSTLQWSGSQIMNASDFVQTSASALGLTISASGGEAV